MGGQLIKGYALEGDSQGAVGLAKSWKLYRGHKAQTHTLASIFLIEKKQLKKAERDEAIRMAKKEAGNLLRVRHPGVLAVVEPLTEDENILAFVTERVEGSMSQLIKTNKMTEFLNSELELKLYLYPFLEAILFIHDTLKQAHLAISPDNIFITTEGKWKIAGFGINQQLNGEEKQNFQEKLQDYSYCAPELYNGNFTKKSDIFSIGIFIVRVLEFINKEGKPHAAVQRGQYEKYTGDLKRLINSPIIAKSSHSADLLQLLRGLLEWQGERRITVAQILSSRWMNDSTLITVKYLDKINNYENKQQLQFLKGLAGVLDDFDARVLARIILPKLIDMLKFGHLIASVAYIIIDLLKKNRLPSDLFNKLVWPALKAIMQGKEMTAQAIYLFVLNYEILEKHAGQADTVSFLLPLYIKCFDCPPKLKQLALKSLERISKKLDYQNFKTRVIPKLLGLFKDPSIDIRKDALRGLYCILKVIDGQTMSLSVLPAIQGARKAGSDPFVNSIINAIYNTLSSSLSSDILCNKILPSLIPYLSDPSISRNEFNQFKGTVINMIAIIEKEREKSFGNSIAVEETHFTEADYRFKEEENKVLTESKGNYSFLQNYIEVKPEPTVGVQNTLPTNVPVPSVPTVTTNIPPPTVSYNPPISNIPQPTISQYSPPIPQSIPTIPPAKQAIQIKSSNIPLQPIQIKTNPISFPIKTEFTDPPSQPISFDFQSLGNYQPLDLNFVSKQPALTFNPQPAPVKPIQKQQKKVELPKNLKNSPVLQSKDSKQSSDEKKHSNKFIGGASGPMQIKKIVGPGQKIKPPARQQPKQQIPTMDLNYFNNPIQKQQTPAFSMDFGNLGSFDMKFSQPAPTSIKPLLKPQPLAPPLQAFTFQPPSLSIAPSDANNPFAELQSSLPSAGSDIYSYFQDDKKGKVDTSMDLI